MANVVVLKLGGSVLVDVAAYHANAALLKDRLGDEPGTRFVVVVSAQCGETDALLAHARAIVEEPDRATLDLLWSTGELRSAATLALCLQRLGVTAVALDVHQTGMSVKSVHTPVVAHAASIQRELTRHDVVIVPGFLAAGPGGAVVSLGRGGSDLSAVALAAALKASRCELLKDVSGYFTADPHRVEDAQHLPAIDYGQALLMARDGCDLVQEAALESAKCAGLTLVIRAANDPRQTVVSVDQSDESATDDSLDVALA